jgi:arsenate reductase
MREVGIDIADYVPQKWSMEMLHEVDVVVTMGCGDTCPYIPGKRYVDWPLDDPAGQGVEAVRPIRDEIKSLVEALLSELAVR